MKDVVSEYSDGTYAGGEAKFEVAEMLYSRTNDRGIIQASNDTFRRVSGFEWAEFLDQPHKILRHADMPKAIYQLYWDRLKNGESVGVYIKNRDKLGRYFWVFSVVSPVPGGFSSIGIRPNGETFQDVPALYGTLLAMENDGKTSRDVAARLDEELNALGYSSYDAFEATALATELKARAHLLGAQLDQTETRILTMSDSISDVQSETNEMTEAFKAIRTVPMNMRIVASRLESAGGPISAISVNYSQMLEEMSTWVKTFVVGEDCVFARIKRAILFAQFMIFKAMLWDDIRTHVERDGDKLPDQIAVTDEVDQIIANRARVLKSASEALANVETEAKRFGRSVLDMKRYVTGLSSTRMMCKIESASLSNTGTALSGIVSQLDACQNEIEQRLARIVELNAVIQSNTSMLRSLL